MGVEDEAARNQLTEANQRNSPLLRLPPELRNRVYEYALGGNDWHIIRDVPPAFKSLRLTTEPNSYTLALLSACRQIHAEAALLPYSLNEFAFKYAADIVDFQNLRIPAQLQAIRSLGIFTLIGKYMHWGYTCRVVDDLSFLGRFSSLERIKVRDTDVDRCFRNGSGEIVYAQLTQQLQKYVPGVGVEFIVARTRTVKY